MCNRLPEINKNGDAGIFPVYYSLKGIGYRVSKEKGKLIFHLGYSHSIILEIPKEITVKFDKNL